MPASREMALDELTELAARLCRVPCAMVVLSTESGFRVESRWGWIQLPADATLARQAHALRGARELRVIADAVQDPRAGGHPLVSGPAGLRFYAGVALRDPVGSSFGTLCIADARPRRLSRTRRQLLRVLARQVVTALRGQLRQSAPIPPPQSAGDTRLALVTDTARVGLVVLDRERRYTFANATYAEFLELPSAEIIGLRVADVLPGLYDEQIRPRLDLAFAGQRISYELCKPGKTGTRWYTVRYELDQDASGVQQVVVVLTDNTEQKAYAETLARSELRYRALFEYAPEGLLIADGHGQCVDANTNLCQMLGFTREQLIGLQSADIVAAVEVSRIEPSLQHIATVGEYAGEWQLRRRDGSVFFAAVKTTRTPDGKLLSVIRDITERRRAEAEIHRLNASLEQRIAERTAQLQTVNAELRESQAQITSLFESLPGAYLVLTPDLTIVAVSDAYLLATMTTREDLLGRQLFHAFPDNPAEEGATGVANLRSSLERVRRTGRPDTMAIQKYDVRNATGTYELRYWSQLNAPILGTCGQLRFIVHRVEDVTEFMLQRARISDEAVLNARVQQMEAEVFRSAQQLQSTNQQLEAANLLLLAANRELEEYSHAVTRDLRVAEAADQVKTAFLATMSHELRTPLNSIIGFTGIVLQGLAGPLTAQQQRQLGMVRSSAGHLLHLINDVLDLTRIESGQLELRCEVLDLPALLEQVLASVRPLAESKHLQLEQVIDSRIGWMHSDPRRLQQIVLNLVQNAIKFTDHGKVEVNVSLDAASDPPRLNIAVTDTGMGIRADDLTLLFQPFRQLAHAPGKAREGTGLGLAICRRLAELLGGTVTARSTWSEGSVFTLTLPWQPANRIPAAPKVLDHTPG